MLGFLRSFLTVKGRQAGDDLVKAIVEADPEAATQAEMDNMVRDLDRTGELLQKLRADYNREVKEAEAAERAYNELMAAAELLQARYQDAGTPEDQRAEIGRSLQTVVTRLEEMAPQVDQERQDVVEVRALLDEAEQAFRDKAQSLTAARQSLERAKRDMQRATIQEQREKEKAARAAELAGITRGSGNKLHTALEAMQKRAEEARAGAETARTKAALLSSVNSPAAGDKLVADALAAVRSGGKALPGPAGGPPALPDLSQRLAALKK